MLLEFSSEVSRALQFGGSVTIPHHNRINCKFEQNKILNVQIQLFKADNNYSSSVVGVSREIMSMLKLLGKGECACGAN